MYFLFCENNKIGFIDILTLEQIWLCNPYYFFVPEKKLFGSLAAIKSHADFQKSKAYSLKEFIQDQVEYHKFKELKKQRIEFLKSQHLDMQAAEKLDIINTSFLLGNLQSFGKGVVFYLSSENDEEFTIKIVERKEVRQSYLSNEFPVAFKKLEDYESFIQLLIEEHPSLKEFILKKKEKEVFRYLI
jgi:hypothetical protein